MTCHGLPSLPDVLMPGRRDFVPPVSAEIERLAVRAWPPAEVEEVGGWLLRRTAGVDRRRSNSLLPPFDDGAALAGLDGALARAVELGVPEAVQVSPLEVHPRLDAELAARGSVVGSPTGVLRGPVGVGESSVAVDVGGLDDRWVDAWARLGGGDAAWPTAGAVLAQLGERGGFAVAQNGGVVVGVGVGVAQDGWLGLFSVTTAPSARRHGVGRAVVGALGGWAAQRGARESYVQVELENLPALAFWASLGFTVAHRYHWRIGGSTGESA